jgi:hypothetical protein
VIRAVHCDAYVYSAHLFWRLVQPKFTQGETQIREGARLRWIHTIGIHTYWGSFWWNPDPLSNMRMDLSIALVLAEVVCS